MCVLQCKCHKMDTEFKLIVQIWWYRAQVRTEKRKRRKWNLSEAHVICSIMFWIAYRSFKSQWTANKESYLVWFRVMRSTVVLRLIKFNSWSHPTLDFPSSHNDPPGSTSLQSEGWVKPVCHGAYVMFPAMCCWLSVSAFCLLAMNESIL